MKVEVEKQENNLVLVKVDISADHAQQEYNKACRRIGQRVNVPGFRRGKAPNKMIEKAVGADRIKQEALERILPHVFADVVSEHQLDIIAPPNVQSFTYELGKGITVEARLETRPEVNLPDLALTVEAERYDAPADQMDKELAAVQDRFSFMEPVTDRPANDTDIVNIDFHGTVNGKAIAGGSAKQYRLDLGSNNFIDGFAQQIVGHSVGETFTIAVTFPEAYFDATLAGQEAKFDITLNEISCRKTPELDEALAKKAGDFETVDALKASIKTRLEKSNEIEQNKRKQSAVVEALVDKVELNLPDSMIDRETNLLIQEAQARFNESNLSWDQFVEAQGKDQVIANMRAESVRRVKTSLIFSTIAKQENLSVGETEFRDQVQMMARERRMDEQAAMRQLANQPEAVQAIADMLMAQKVIDFLVGKATFTLVDPKPATELPTELDDLSGHVHTEACQHGHHHHHDEPSVAAAKPAKKVATAKVEAGVTEAEAAV
jgi:trigger factor